jgi:uncharacterized membrane protein YccC
MAFNTLATERLVHAFKTGLACLIGFGVASILPFHANQWLIITILVVMCAQMNVGSVVNKSIMRFLGTFIGSLLAGLTLLAFGVNPIGIVVIVALSSMGFSYIATDEKNYSDAGTLGAVTVTVILLGVAPSYLNALQRFVEISLGILIATLVSQFVLPIRARDHLRRMQSKTVAQLGEYYQVTFVANPNEMVIQELDEAIVKSLSAQRALAKQASREPFGAYDPLHFNNLLACEKEIFRSIVCMHYAGDMLPPGKNIFIEMPAIREFHNAICAAFGKISHGIEENKFTETLISIPTIYPLKETIHQLRQTMDADDIIYLDGFLFCAEILLVQLTEMVLLLKTKFPQLPEDQNQGL